MYPFPCAKKRCQILLKHILNAGQIACREAVVLPQSNRIRRIIQSKDSLMTLPDDMHMRRAMIIWVNSHPQGANPQNGWHELILS
jgi:hypothetical protein